MLLLCELLLVLLGAWLSATLARRLRLPALLGMLAGGAAAAALPVGPWLQALSGGSPGTGLEAVDGPLRLGVLALVLLRAGLGLAPAELKRAGWLAVRLGSLPMFAEGFAVTVAGHLLLGLPWASAAVLGFLVAAVSPAIVVPGLLDLMAERTGRARRVLVALLAGAPLDNVLALALLGACLDLALTGEGSWSAALTRVPVGLVVSILAGVAAGWLLARWLADAPARLAARWGAAVLAWTLALILLAGLRLAGMPLAPGLVAMGCATRWLAPIAAVELSRGLARAWKPSAYLLFGLIGAAVDPAPLFQVGLAALLVLAAGQLLRAAGAWLATAGSQLRPRERLACAAAYVPKATIQAAFAAVPLDRGLPEGALVLGIGVLAVAVTAPIGVITLMKGAPALLDRSETEGQTRQP